MSRSFVRHTPDECDETCHCCGECYQRSGASVCQQTCEHACTDDEDEHVRVWGWTSRDREWSSTFDSEDAARAWAEKYHATITTCTRLADIPVRDYAAEAADEDADATRRFNYQRGRS